MAARPVGKNSATTSEISAPGSRVLVISVDGRLDRYSASELRAQLDGWLAHQARPVVLDFQKADIVDSVALAVLVGAIKRLHNRNCPIAIIAGEATNRHLLQITGVANLVHVV